ncbi:phenylalanyl-tRNA synthetase subunit beta [Pseudooctadecabacter sp.]|uniref:phenylalanyl-tRNA synthetase subunit beta n=1 Tax=Pseudooctadecabacter sp. TaxID=1966338 RepID=UPI0025D28F0C|nr:phenylalanyl-tRNA synthetase subunit beta [Pseudooctadecabacter sp.]
MTKRLMLGLAALVTLIVVAHIGLWRDPDIPLEAKRRLTALNALGWAVIILPVFAVNQWLKAKTRKD